MAVALAVGHFTQRHFRVPFVVHIGVPGAPCGRVRGRGRGRGGGSGRGVLAPDLGVIAPC